MPAAREVGKGTVEMEKRGRGRVNREQRRTLAHVVGLDAITELDGLVDTGRGTRRDGGSELALVLELREEGATEEGRGARVCDGMGRGEAAPVSSRLVAVLGRLERDERCRGRPRRWGFHGSRRSSRGPGREGRRNGGCGRG